MSKHELIERWIEEDPSRPGPDNARIAGHGASVWAIIGYVRALDGNVGRAAADYSLPEEAVAAALAYYERNRPPIDARLAANAAPATKA